MDFSNISSIILPQGEVKSIVDSANNILWQWKELACLVSTGKQVIDTGVYCTPTMSCEIKMAYTALPTTATYIGAIEYSDSTYYRCHFQVSTAQNLIGFWQDSPTMGNVVSVAFDTNYHVFKYSAKDLTVGIDDVSATHGNTPPPTNSTFYLFDRNVVGFTANAEPGKCKLEYAKFWDDGVLIRHFVPRLNMFDKAGLFDMVNKEYYYDLNGNDFDYELL